MICVCIVYSLSQTNNSPNYSVISSYSNKITTLSHRNENTIILEIDSLYLTCKLKLNIILSLMNEVYIWLINT